MPIILVLLKLILLGFAMYLFDRFLAPKLHPLFKVVIYFIIVLAVILWLLDGFGLFHAGKYLRWGKH